MYPVLLCHSKKNLDRPCWVRSSRISQYRQHFPDKTTFSTKIYHVGISTTSTKCPFLHNFTLKKFHIFESVFYFTDLILLYWIPAQWIILNNSSLFASELIVWGQRCRPCHSWVSKKERQQRDHFSKSEGKFLTVSVRYCGNQNSDENFQNNLHCQLFCLINN